MRYVHLVQSTHIEETDLLMVFSSKKKALHFISQAPEDYYYLGKHAVF